MPEPEKLCRDIQKYFTGREPHFIDEADYIRAAVMLPLLRAQDGLRVLFEVRSPDLSWQPGEICFPGGRIEAGDSGPRAAAIRESCEELALQPEDIEIFGALDFITTYMGVIAYPYVGFIKDTGRIRASKSEVAEIFTVPLRWFMQTKPIEANINVNTEAAEDFPFRLLPGYTRAPHKRKGYKVYFYQYEGHVIWGLTARILYGFLQNCRDIFV